jgi:hypothetical protein
MALTADPLSFITFAMERFYTCMNGHSFKVIGEGDEPSPTIVAESSSRFSALTVVDFTKFDGHPPRLRSQFLSESATSLRHTLALDSSTLNIGGRTEFSLSAT